MRELNEVIRALASAFSALLAVALLVWAFVKEMTTEEAALLLRLIVVLLLFAIYFRL